MNCKTLAPLALVVAGSLVLGSMASPSNAAVRGDHAEPIETTHLLGIYAYGLTPGQANAGACQLELAGWVRISPILYGYVPELGGMGFYINTAR